MMMMMMLLLPMMILVRIYFATLVDIDTVIF